MSRQRFLWLVIAACVVLGGALWFSSLRNASTVAVGAPLLPKLEPVANTITAVTVRHASPTPTATIHQQNGEWTVAERADYPADLSKVRKLVQALVDAKIVEEKTADPAKYAAIGVDDPSASGASGSEITLTTKDGKQAVIVGRPAGEGNFVRRSGEKTSYIVEPSIPVETEPKYWIDTAILDIPATTIESIELKSAGGPGYTVRRPPAAEVAGTPDAHVKSAGAGNGASAAGSSSGGNASAAPPAASHQPAAAGAGAAPGAHGNAADYALEGVPAGRKAAEPATLAPSPSTLSGLTADDVVQASNVDFTKPTVATFTFTDGSTLTITGSSSGDKHWIEINSGKDTALNKKSAGRAYEIPGYRYDAIFRPLDQLLVPKEPPPSAKGKDGAPVSSPNRTKGTAGGAAKPKSSPAS